MTESDAPTRDHDEVLRAIAEALTPITLRYGIDTVVVTAERGTGVAVSACSTVDEIGTYVKLLLDVVCKLDPRMAPMSTLR